MSLKLRNSVRKLLNKDKLESLADKDPGVQIV